MHQFIRWVDFLLITEMFSWINCLEFLHLDRLNAMLLVSDLKKNQFKQNYGEIELLGT